MPRIGCDIVSLKKFSKKVERSGEAFLRKIFLPSELKHRDLQHLAGIFAAKEAILKAAARSHDLRVGDWHEIEICSSPSKRPFVRLRQKRIHALDISISHDGDYVFAVVIHENPR